jgi:hypothetical protein
VPDKGAGGADHQKRDQAEMGGGKRKTRIFAPVTLKMIFEAAPRPDDVLEIEGENIADVSLSNSDSSFTDHPGGPCSRPGIRTNEDPVYHQ